MTDWMTIRVVLAGQPEAPLPQPPGRTMLAYADHSFADLAEAIDTAFARWDLTPLHQFEVEGRVLLPGEAAGALFTYVFDLGEEWTHECVVEEVGVDPFEVAGEEPEVPVPVFGWGTVPDQYGRVTEDDEEGHGARAVTGWSEGDLDDEYDDSDYGEDDYDDDDDEEDDYDDDEDDDWPDGATSWPVVRDALAGVQRSRDDEALQAATARLRERAGVAGPEQVLWAAGGLDPAGAPDDDEDLWLALAAGVIAPRPDAAEPEVLAAWDALEPADWAGAVIEIVRAGPGVEVTPAGALEAIARCPEVEENDLTDDSESLLLRGLEVVIGLWQALGVLDADRRLTPLGQWGLPEALRRAWDSGPVAGEAGAAGQSR